jgi:hypothetical protein
MSPRISQEGEFFVKIVVPGRYYGATNGRPLTSFHLCNARGDAGGNAWAKGGNNMTKTLRQFVFALLMGSVLTIGGLAQSPSTYYWQDKKPPEKTKEKEKEKEPKRDEPKKDDKKKP